jgi:TIR domain/Sel1 repeat
MIAISYRREDSLPIAGRLYDRLQTKFGKKNVFMDFDSIPPGMDFREQIKQMIERSNLVIAIIGPNWLGEQPDASRRIDNPADFVRLEIAYALKRGIPVIPVLVNNTPMPSSQKLPQEIEGLAFRNAVTLDTGIDFHHHADRLIEGIRKAMVVAPRSGERQEVREPTPVAVHTLSLRKIFIWSAAILLAVVASATWFLVGHRHEQETNATGQSVGVELPKPVEAESSVGPTASAPTPTTELSPGVAEAQANSAVVSEATSPPGIADAATDYDLGVRYETGQGVPKDLRKAAEHFQKAANQGYALAQNNLGALYAVGQGVPKDLRKAAELYQKAAAQGSQTAILSLKSLSAH